MTRTGHLTNRPPLGVLTALIVGSAVAVDPGGKFPFGPLRFTVISTLILVAVAIAMRRGGWELHMPSALGWAALLALGVVAGIGALDPLYTWLGTPDRHMGLLTAALFGAAFLVGQTVHGADAVRTILKAVVIALAAIGIYTVLEVAGLAPVDVATPSGRPGGPFGTAAYLGAACALLIPVAIGAAIDGLGSRLWRFAGLAAVGLGGFASLASQTRAGWFGLGAAALISLPATGPWLRRYWKVTATAVVLLAVVALASPVGGRIAAGFDLTDGTARGRIDEWQVGAAVVVAHPVVGVGFEGYRIAFAEGVDADYERRYTRVTMPDRAHNGPLDVAAATGIAGMALYLLAGGFLMTRAWTVMLGEPARLAGIGAAVAGYIAQQFFLFPIAEVDPIFWLLAGVLVAADLGGKGVVVRPSRWAWTVPALLAAIALAAGTADVVADHRLAASARHATAGEMNEALQAADAATTLRPDSIRYHFVAAVMAAKSGTTTGYSRAVSRLDDALEVSPGDPILRAEHAAYLLRMAQAGHDPAALTAATSEWESLVGYDQVNARYRLELGNAYAIAGSRQEAEVQWLIAADLAPTSTAPLTNLAAIYVEFGRIDEARRLLDQARSIDPVAPEIARVAALIDP